MKQTLFLLSLTIAISITACNLVPPMTKGMYISQYESFINEVATDSENYNAEKWEVKNDEFRKFSREYYEQFKADLTEDERDKVMALKIEYFKYKAVKKGKDLLNNLEDALLGD